MSDSTQGYGVALKIRRIRGRDYTVVLAESAGSISGRLALALADGALFTAVIIGSPFGEYKTLAIPLSIFLLLAAPFLLNWKAHRTLSIPTLVIVGAVGVYIVIVGQQVAANPTSHNLWPFEFFGFVLLIGIPTFAAAMFSRLIYRLTYGRSHTGGNDHSIQPPPSTSSLE